MQHRSIIRLGLGLVCVVIGVFVGFRNRAEDSKDVEKDALKILSMMDEYPANKSILDTMAKKAHVQAFDAAYTEGSRRRDADLDAETYLSVFFDEMVREADRINRPDLKKAIMNFRDMDDDSEDSSDDTMVADVGATRSGRPAASKKNDDNDAEQSSDKGTDAADAAAKASPNLTRAEFDALPDDELMSTLFEKISAVATAEAGKEVESLEKLSKGQRMVFVVTVVENELKHAGFKGFFENTTGALTPLAVPAYTLVGAKKHATIMKRGISAYARLNEDQDIFEEDKAVKSYMKKYKKDKSLKTVDKSFKAVKEEVDKLCVKYIREHADQFVSE